LELLGEEHRRDKTAIATLAHEWMATYEKTFNKSS
jgi:hypothetical protein